MPTSALPSSAVPSPAVALPVLLVAMLAGLLGAAPAASADVPAPQQGLVLLPDEAPAPAAAPAPAPAPASAPAPAVVAATRPAFSLPAAGARVVAEAATHKGKPYVWGATGPSRFDCSGYVRYVFSRVGKALPRTSGQQYAASRRIAKTAKQPGDLIFTRSSSGRISHVGIYAGAGTFWVAPKAGDVVKRQRIYTSNYSVGRV